VSCRVPASHSRDMQTLVSAQRGVLWVALQVLGRSVCNGVQDMRVVYTGQSDLHFRPRGSWSVSLWKGVYQPQRYRQLLLTTASWSLVTGSPSHA
jgi:hypothetical protein